MDLRFFFGLTAFVLALGSTTVEAQSRRPVCDQDEATQRWLRAESTGTVLGFIMFQRTVTIHVPLRNWNLFRLDHRVGLFTLLDCVIGGPDGVVKNMQAVDERGRVLATWDGTRWEIDVRR